jgi:hypothetical protein
MSTVDKTDSRFQTFQAKQCPNQKRKAYNSSTFER